MKKILAVGVAALMLAASLASCASSGDPNAIDDYTPENLTAETNEGTYTYERADGDAVILAKYESKKTHGDEVDVPATVELEGTPRRVIGIGKDAFKGLSSVTKITVAASVLSIGDYAFADCVYLKDVSFEKDSQLTTVGEAAFHQCVTMKSIDFSGTKLAAIGMSAFDSCTALETVTLSNSLVSVGMSAFFDCAALKSLTLPDTVTTIDDLAFYGCTAMETLVLSNGLTEMGQQALLLTKDTDLADKIDTSNLDEDSYAYQYIEALISGEIEIDTSESVTEESATEESVTEESVTDESNTEESATGESDTADTDTGTEA